MSLHQGPLGVRGPQWELLHTIILIARCLSVKIFLQTLQSLCTSCYYACVFFLSGRLIHVFSIRKSTGIDSESRSGDLFRSSLCRSCGVKVKHGALLMCMSSAFASVTNNNRSSHLVRARPDYKMMIILPSEPAGGGPVPPDHVWPHRWNQAVQGSVKGAGGGFNCCLHWTHLHFGLQSSCSTTDICYSQNIRMQGETDATIWSGNHKWWWSTISFKCLDDVTYFETLDWLNGIVCQGYYSRQAPAYSIRLQGERGQILPVTCNEMYFWKRKNVKV